MRKANGKHQFFTGYGFAAGILQLRQGFAL
jgi:hypothetical protein